MAMSTKIGRNDPCPCGSGKNYKKCCLAKLESKRKIPDVSDRIPVKEPVHSLRDKITRFMERGNFKSSFEPATQLYWNTIEEGLQPPGKMEEADVSGLMEWFIHDYILPEYKKTIIALFLESNPRLTKEELQILKDWQMTNISVFQIHRVEEGHGIYAEDIFTGEECYLRDVSISKAAKQWELLITRRVWVLKEWQLSAVGRILPPQEKGEIYDFVMAHYRDYQRDHPGATIVEFLHVKGYLLNNYVLTRAVKPVEMPTFVTSDGEEILICEAIFDVLDFEKAVKKLSKTPDYQMASQIEDEEGQQYTFNWLERGETPLPSQERDQKRRITYQSFYTDGPGHESHRVLGNVDVYQDRLKLSVLGKERFKVGKDLLKKHLKMSINHRIDTLQSLDAKMREDKKGSRAVREKIDPDLERKLLKDLFDDHYKMWLDSKIPALEYTTPREASKTKEGQEKLEDLLRVLEYEVRRQKETGLIDYDISWIREELAMIKDK